MLKRYHQVIGSIFRATDALVIASAWLISYWARFKLPLLTVTKGFPKFETYAALTPLVVILWIFIFSTLNVYDSKRMLRRTDEAFAILRAHGTALLFFISLTYLISEYKYSRGVMLYFGILGGFSLVLFRLFLRNGLRTLRKKGYNLRYVLMVGEGGSVPTLITRLEKFPELGLRVKGVLVSESSPTHNIAGKPKLGTFSEIQSVVQNNGIDQVLIALSRQEYGQLDRILAELKDEVVDLQVVPDVHEYVTLGCAVEDFDGLPIVNLNDSPLNGWGAISKRITDFLCSLMALILLSPALAFIAMMVKLTSRGPIFYAQERMGLDGRTFLMLKFRSMRVDAEKVSGAVWAKQNDDRRTPIGAFLRATSLDELPQFWNVLKGEMSLVGPRPERPVFVQQFKNDIPHYMLRHKVKAGITGWAQVNGWRGNTSLDSRIECDLFYIRNWSYALDWKILFLTLWKGFIHKNAY